MAELWLMRKRITVDALIAYFIIMFCFIFVKPLHASISVSLLPQMASRLQYGYPPYFTANIRSVPTR
jgi:hypothetical protein